MTIFDFDTNKGIYHFEFSGLKTEMHAHPVVEMIIAKEGSFCLRTEEECSERLAFAVIDANAKHQVEAEECTLEVLMLESHNDVLNDFLDKHDIVFEKGVFTSKDVCTFDHLIPETKSLAESQDLISPSDDRIQQCIEFIRQNEIEYIEMMKVLTEKVFLSESRLSHLFKEHIGVSVKKYLVWDKLRKAISQYIHGNHNLTEVSLQSGFFDQAHLSKVFKSVLGVSPSSAYNSRTLQS